MKIFDAEKGWKHAYGSMFFSEGIVDIKGNCAGEKDLDEDAYDEDELKGEFGDFTGDKDDERIYVSPFSFEFKVVCFMIDQLL